jgi:hypothetical protein
VQHCRTKVRHRRTHQNKSAGCEVLLAVLVEYEDVVFRISAFGSTVG